MTPERLKEITALRDTYGDSLDQQWSDAYLALDDLLVELAAVTELRHDEWAARARDARCPLTEKQLAVLLDAANGITSVEHARGLGTAISTVNSRRITALRILRTHSAAHGVAVCMAEGWITPADIKIPERWT